MFNMLDQIITAGQYHLHGYTATPQQRATLEALGVGAAGVACSAVARSNPLVAAVATIASMTLLIANGFGEKEARFTGDRNVRDFVAAASTLKVVALVNTGLLAGVGAIIGRVRPDIGAAVHLLSVIGAGAALGISLHSAAHAMNR